MKGITVKENQRGLLFKKGKYVKTLGAGKYILSRGSEVEIAHLDQPILPRGCSLDTLLKDAALKGSVSLVEVGDEELALHYVNGNFSSVLRTGRHAFWSVTDTHTFEIVDISTPKVSESVPRHVFTRIPSALYTKVEVAAYQKARLYFDQRLEAILDAGTYYFWKTPVKIDVSYVDTRLLGMTVTGQEILSADKVSLRISFVCSYRITDYVRVLTDIDDYEEQMHVAVQLALREFVGKHKLDEILEAKDEMASFVYERLKARESSFFVEILDAGIKDIILPGEVREIMNTVLVAEKRAQANVITRREEVASTRSLLNTARMMDENQTLYKLKELEYVERICENVGSITLGGNGDVLSQLTGILRGNA